MKLVKACLPVVVTGAVVYGINWALLPNNASVAICLLSGIVIGLVGWMANTSYERDKPEKVKRGVSGLMVFAILLASTPQTQGRPGNDDTDPDAIAIACVTLAVGGVIVWGVWKLCQRIPQPNGPPAPPPPTNYPPAIISPTNVPSIRTNGRPSIKLSSLNAAPMPIYDIASAGYTDPVTGSPITHWWTTSLEQSADLNSWQTTLSVTGYVSVAGEYISFWTNGTCAANVSVTPGTTNYVPDVLNEEPSKSQFYRLKQ